MKHPTDEDVDNLILGWAEKYGLKSLVRDAYNRGHWRGSETGEQRGRAIQREVHKERQRKAKKQ
jgi:hypothetical protein